MKEIDNFDFSKAMRSSVEMCEALLDHCRELVKEKEKYKELAESLLKDENPTMMSTAIGLLPVNVLGMQRLNDAYEQVKCELLQK